MDMEQFEPKLGRMRGSGSRRGRKYLHRVLVATALAGGLRRAGRGRFDGGRIVRGAATARSLGSRTRSISTAGNCSRGSRSRRSSARARSSASPAAKAILCARCGNRPSRTRPMPAIRSPRVTSTCSRRSESGLAGRCERSSRRISSFVPGKNERWPRSGLDGFPTGFRSK